jgi:hypothetical protein
MGDGVGDQTALFLGLATLDLHGDELGGALAVAHDGLGQQARHSSSAAFRAWASALSQLAMGALPALWVAISTKSHWWRCRRRWSRG